MSYGVGNVGAAGGYGPGYGCVSPVNTGCGGGFSTLGIILVLFILLVIISRSILC
ncbi:MAG: sporulation protein YjcZ [Candidatus Pristimantibacillus sp.]